MIIFVMVDTLRPTGTSLEREASPWEGTGSLLRELSRVA